MPDMTRNPDAGNIQVGALIANSEAFPLLGAAGGHIHVPSGETATLTFYVPDSEELDTANWNLHRLEDGSAHEVSVSGGRAFPLHPALFAALGVKIVASAISSGTSVTYRITTKS
jgi:hypothetical protein